MGASTHLYKRVCPSICLPSVTRFFPTAKRLWKHHIAQLTQLFFIHLFIQTRHCCMSGFSLPQFCSWFVQCCVIFLFQLQIYLAPSLRTIAPLYTHSHHYKYSSFPNYNLYLLKNSLLSNPKDLSPGSLSFFLNSSHSYPTRQDSYRYAIKPIWRLQRRSTIRLTSLSAITSLETTSMTFRWQSWGT